MSKKEQFVTIKVYIDDTIILCQEPNCAGDKFVPKRKGLGVAIYCVKCGKQRKVKIKV